VPTSSTWALTATLLATRVGAGRRHMSDGHILLMSVVIESNRRRSRPNRPRGAWVRTCRQAHFEQQGARSGCA
jgi:hypothetical protein